MKNNHKKELLRSPIGESKARSLAKAIIYRILIILTDIIVIYLLTKRYDVALWFTAISNIVTTILYYFHERIWNKINWGKTTNNQQLTTNN